MNQSDINRFWTKVDKKSDEECWNWKGTIQNAGYGQFWLDYGMKLAHRVSYEIHTGKKNYQNLLHICDNPRCVNPYHLKEGTQSDNVSDMFEKGRQGDGRHFGPHYKQHNYPLFQK